MITAAGPHFIVRPHIMYVGGTDPWLVVRDGVYQSALYEALEYFNGGLITIEEGYLTDLATVPRLPWIYAGFGDRAVNASILHDWLYSNRLGNRRLADNLFREAMGAERDPVQGWKRSIMHGAVRLFGGLYWST
jgi:hypothetical protein